MSQTLNAIALISGGKDSIYSILHCLQHGHKIIALGNLYPQSANPQAPHDDHVESSGHNEEDDLNSFMYQTVGHTVIQLYEQILKIPLYRQPIIGGAVHTGSTYTPSSDGSDETESLVPLLKRIMAAHPEANALSTGAILSTYQRTRVESVTLRLGLVPLAFLWQYPNLPPGTQSSLLEDMASAGLDARIIKVASGGLDESFLWRNVASRPGIQDLERAIARFGGDGDGAVLGEGGEFETLVLDGPHGLFGGRLVVEEGDRHVVREGGGAAWLGIRSARLEMRDEDGGVEQDGRVVLRVPDLLESRFTGTLWSLLEDEDFLETTGVEHLYMRDSGKGLRPHGINAQPILSRCRENDPRWMFVARMSYNGAIEQEVEDIVDQMRVAFQDQNIKVSDVVSTLIVLRSIKDFAIINQVYGALFNEANPPSRVTIACGDALPLRYNIMIHLHLFRKHKLTHLRRALHVQSRSYWAPANIGPYSQAQSIPLSAESTPTTGPSQVHIAGQIPLVPSTMALPESSGTAPAQQMSDFKTQILLSLQHLFRIGRAMNVSWFTGAVAYLSRETDSASSVLSLPLRARLAGLAWRHQHARRKHGSIRSSRSDLASLSLANDDDDDEEEEDPPRDLWDERHNFSLHHHHQSSTRPTKTPLPNWSIIRTPSYSTSTSTSTSYSFISTSTPETSTVSTIPTPHHLPPFFAAELQSLPAASPVEWSALSGLASTNPITISSGSADMLWHRKGKTITKKDAFAYYTCRIEGLWAEVVMMLPWGGERGRDDEDISGADWKHALRACSRGLVGEEAKKREEEEKEEEDVKDEPRARPTVEKGRYQVPDSTWLDISIQRLWETNDANDANEGEPHNFDWTGVIPCWSLWAADGKRLSAVLRFHYDLTGSAAAA